MKELKYPLDFKKDVCEYAKKENIKTAAAVHGLNPDTVGRWYRKYKTSGIKGLKIRRTSSLKSKLDPAGIEEILKELESNPNLKLREIKEKFCPDCSLSLISRKLNKSKFVESENSKKHDIFFTLRIIRHVKFKNETSLICQLTLHNRSGKVLFTGFSITKYSSDICYFIRLGLSFLKKRKKNRFRIVTNIPFLKRNDFKTLVAEDYNARLIKTREMTAKPRLRKCSDEKVKSAEDAIFETYKEMFNQFDRSDNIKNLLFTPVIDINYHKKNKKKLGAFTLPSETKNTIRRVLNKIKKEGDAAAADFDYDKAFKEYDKAYMALTLTNAGSVSMQIELLLKKAKLLYDTEKYQASLMILRDCVSVSKKNGLHTDLSDSYYYLGMIYNIFHYRKGALRYMRLSAAALQDITGDKAKCFYHRALFKKSYYTSDYDKAMEYLVQYKEYAEKTGEVSLIGNCLSQYGFLYYCKGDYESAGKFFEISLMYNERYRNVTAICENISGLINLCCMGYEIDQRAIDELLEKLKKISSIAGISYKGYESDYRLGVYYYTRSEYERALYYLKKALEGKGLHNYHLLYLSNLYYLGRVYFTIKDYIKAIRNLRLLTKESLRNKNYLYNLYSQRIISKIFYNRNDNKRAIPQAKKVLKLALRHKEFYISGESCKLIADLYENRNRITLSQRYYKRSLQYFNKYQSLGRAEIKDEINIIESK